MTEKQENWAWVIGLIVFVFVMWSVFGLPYPNKVYRGKVVSIQVTQWCGGTSFHSTTDKGFIVTTTNRPKIGQKIYEDEPATVGWVWKFIY
jgi:hypothetical protein